MEIRSIEAVSMEVLSMEMRSRVIIGIPEWNVGGPCVFAERLARGLTGLGWDARVLVTEMNTNLLQTTLTPRAMPDDVAIDLLPVGPDDSWGMRWVALVRYLEEHAPCIYIVNCDWRNSIVVARLSNRVKVIGLIHADYELEYNQIERLGNYFNAIVAVSDPIQFNAIHRYAPLGIRTTTIRNAVPGLERMPEKPADGPLRICYSGELRHAQKKLNDMVQVILRLHAKNVDFEMTFLGDGAMRAELEEPLRPLMAMGKVRFAGRLPMNELLDELKRYHVFMLTSEFEGLSIALLEAMSRGCIPVVTDLVTQSLVTRNGVNSFCLPVGDIDGFVSRLTSLAHDPELRRQMGNAAFQTIADDGYRIQDMLQAYIRLFAQVNTMEAERRFVRHRGWMMPPPKYVGDTGILPMSHPIRETDMLNRFPLWPEAPPSLPQIAPPMVQKQTISTTKSKTKSKTKSPVISSNLEDYKVIAAIPGGQISGVDTFACHLIRDLRARGIEAKIVGGRVLNHTMGLPLPEDIPVESPVVSDDASWLERWDAMVDYLEEQAPCIYIPNYDYDHSGICPRLSNRVKVVNIAHSDDPAHYEHTIRLGRFSDALIGVSRAIVEHLAGMDASLASRLYHVPYGIELPAYAPRVPDPNAPIRLIYVGRLMAYQKRVMDLIWIAKGLEKRNIPFEITIIGDGPEREEMYTHGKELILKRRLWFLGKLSNSEVMQQLQEHDVFLLPSAFEGLSVSLLEAMANGVVPLVSAMRSGVPELIRHGQNGLIAPISAIDQYCEHIVQLYRCPEQRLMMSRSAYETIRTEGYLVEDMVARYRKAFSEMLAGPYIRPYGPLLPPSYLENQLVWHKQMGYRFGKSMKSARDMALNVKQSLQGK